MFVYTVSFICIDNTIIYAILKINLALLSNARNWLSLLLLSMCQQGVLGKISVRLHMNVKIWLSGFYFLKGLEVCLLPQLKGPCLQNLHHNLPQIWERSPWREKERCQRVLISRKYQGFVFLSPQWGARPQDLINTSYLQF